ncbi:MAG: TonB-dependent receptor plug domain-containing protein [Vicinamibacterales bacterium]
MLTRQILLSTLLGLTVHAPDAVAQPTTACAVRLVVVDPNGVTLAARVDVLEPESGDVDATMAACIRAGTGVRRIRLMISADGYQPHATDTIEIDPAAARDVVVTLMPPFSESLTVEGRGANMVGIAESASAGVVGANDLASRPLVRAGDIIEAVPGVAMTQHSSGGHAPIILLRGYNLDHGTDFATALEGAPLNLPSHAHAQGYTDTNFLIEDVVGRIEFQKGPYSARTGNFSTAGSANIELAETLERPVLRVEGGGNGFARVMAAGFCRARNETGDGCVRSEPRRWAERGAGRLHAMESAGEVLRGR